jgi:hypothetical protein
MNRTNELLVIELWKPLNKEVVGASELEFIQESSEKSFGTGVSPASIARALADHGALLRHPDILATDMRWRERNLLLTAEDLTFGTLAAATALIEKLELLREQFEEDDTARLGHLRQSVQQLKNELELLAAGEKCDNRKLAREVAQWLTVWLQTPQIFREWLSLRRATTDFRDCFGSAN